MEDGTIFAQVYGSDDVACEGDIHLDTLMFSRADGVAQPGTICALGEFADGHKEYYRWEALRRGCVSFWLTLAYLAR